MTTVADDARLRGPGRDRVIVGMSGGVDSSVAAWLLKDRGYEVAGLFMKNWEEDDGTEQCTAREDLADARAVCDAVGIELHVANFAAEYWDNVFERFLAECRAGRTPNPDVLCNREIKFKAFLDYALELGADLIATGHYARRRDAGASVWLQKGLDPDKDQSYFLCEVTEACLAKSLFPLGAMRKSEVRRLAAERGLATRDKKDSTGICFIGERRFKDFLERYIPARPGRIESVDGEPLGVHAGLMYYTHGQRQGLGIGGVRNRPEAAWYVADKDAERNVLVVAQGNDNAALHAAGLVAGPPVWINRDAPSLPLACAARIRYRQDDQPCRVSGLDDGRIRVDFERPQRAVTPGQYVVFYDGERCLGGAVIDSFLR